LPRSSTYSVQHFLLASLILIIILSTQLTRAWVKDPKAPHIEEGAGAVANDSLAAESSRTGGEFSENRHSEPLGVKGANSTFANTDTSAADTLEPAVDSEKRKAANESSDSSYPSATGGQSKSTGVTDKTSSVEAGDAEVHAEVHADPAPTYVNIQFIDKKGPKGRNLKEGGFDDDDSKNESFNSDIGDENDPGRIAELKFAKENVERAAKVAPKQKRRSGVGSLGEGLFDKLEETLA
jgi:hypothetical protein